jgi:transcriptional regulator with XRE-family HTH domain
MHEVWSMVKRKPTPKLDRLFKRVRAVTSQPGSLKRLARFLGVSPQTLSDWLGGRFEPGGEVTLKLQKWVIAAEATQQKKTAGRVSARPRRVTRKDQSTTNEKAKSDLRKR